MLFFRLYSHENEDPGQWQLWKIHRKRQIRTLFFNPQGNLCLALNSMIQHLISDLEKFDEGESHTIENLVSFQLVQNLVAFNIKNHFTNNHYSHYQFKICTIPDFDRVFDAEDILISSVYEV